MAFEMINILDPVHCYFAFSEGRSTCLTSGCGVAIKGKNITNLKYHLREKHSKEYVTMLSKCNERDNKIQKFFEFNDKIGKSKCKICGVFFKGNKCVVLKIHFNKHLKEKHGLNAVESIPQLRNSSARVENANSPEQSNSIQPKPSKTSKKRQKLTASNVTSPLLKEPFKEGWKREIVYRTNSNSKILCDVYYHSPEGKKLRSGPEISNHLNEISSRLTLEHFTFFRDLIGVGSQEIVRKANPKSYRLSNAKTAKLSVDTKKKFRAQTSKLRRNANKKKALKAQEEKRRRKFKKDQALRIRQEKLQKNLHKLGVDLKETTLPLDLPLTAPIYLPLGTTLVLSDISSIKIEYSNTCATVEHDASRINCRPVSPTITAAAAAAAVSALRIGESNIEEQHNNYSAPAVYSRSESASCSLSVASQTAIVPSVEEPKTDFQNLTRSFHSQSQPKRPNSFLEHLELITNGKPVCLQPVKRVNAAPCPVTETNRFYSSNCSSSD
ncbi:uncharacterized protein LOC124191273 [Daphnia pulex]|uniref:uncharacterized protein LOC124191273 n=1 Tax=Daphnia pulex TaxID=6669 RepID=UPI001EDF876D|nr:uncharacterized protein LOC124191273 [Daphnia pulex]